MTRLFVLVRGTEPAMIVGYAPGPKGQPLAVLLSDKPTLEFAPVQECYPPKIPKRLRKRIHAHGKRIAREYQEALAVEQVQ